MLLMIFMVRILLEHFKKNNCKKQIKKNLKQKKKNRKKETSCMSNGKE